MVTLSSLVFALLAASFAELSAGQTPSGATTLDINFNTYVGGSVVDFLSDVGLAVSAGTIGTTPYPHVFEASNVGIANSTLTLTVRPGLNSDGAISSAEVSTVWDILHGNITTRAKISAVAGTCASSFFYKNDNSEIDIELLSSYVTTGYGNLKPGIQVTNQPLVKGEDSTTASIPYPFDPTTDFHDYTIEWSSGRTRFFADGQLIATFTTNVPSSSGPWVWNNWSSGNVNWTAGPPLKENVYQIERISGYYFTSM